MLRRFTAHNGHCIPVDLTTDYYTWEARKVVSYEVVHIDIKVLLSLSSTVLLQAWSCGQDRRLQYMFQPRDWKSYSIQMWTGVKELERQDEKVDTS